MPRREVTKYTAYVTVNPCPSREFYGKRYDFLKQIEQKRVIQNVLEKSIECQLCDFEISKIYYEETKKGNMHAHFQITATSATIREMQIYVATKLGNTKLSPDICCHICPAYAWKPKINPDTEEIYQTWLEYCQKGYDYEEEFKCKCFDCLIERESKGTMTKLEYGIIDIPPSKKKTCPPDES